MLSVRYWEGQQYGTGAQRLYAREEHIIFAFLHQSVQSLRSCSVLLPSVIPDRTLAHSQIRSLLKIRSVSIGKRKLLWSRIYESKCPQANWAQMGNRSKIQNFIC